MHHSPHHVLQAHRKVYFFLLKEVSYDLLQKSWAFQPAGLQHTNTPRLLLSYTIVPINEWNLFTSLTVSASSLVWICATGLYRIALGYVIGASRNQANECALVAVLPKVNYLDIPSFTENKRDCNPPPKKWSKIKSPSPHPQLFDPTRVRIHRPWQAISQPHDLYATLYDNGFHNFFKDKFLDIMSNGESYTFDLNDFTWSVRQQEVDTVVNESSSSRRSSARHPLFIITVVISITLACRFYRFINSPCLQLTTNSNSMKYYHSLRAIWPLMFSIHSSCKCTGRGVTNWLMSRRPQSTLSITSTGWIWKRVS